jgi:hypothetical protein
VKVEDKENNEGSSPSDSEPDVRKGAVEFDEHQFVELQGMCFLLGLDDQPANSCQAHNNVARESVHRKSLNGFKSASDSCGEGC